MDKSFYNLFECETKEELYSKIKQKDPLVKELLDFYEYKNNRAFKKVQTFDNPEKLVFEFANLDKDINKMQTIFMNNKLQPILIKEYENVQDKSKEELIKEILTDKYLSSAPSFFVFTNSKEFNTLDIEKLGTHGLLDCFIYDYSESGCDDYYSIKGKGYIDISDNYRSVVMSDYNLIENEDLINHEFQEYYSKSENIGLNFIKDLKDVKKNLKFGFEDLDYEISGIIMLDKEYNIMDQQIINVGNINSSVIDKNRILKNLLTTQNAHKWVLFHNHPSGNNEPSIQDLKITDDLIQISSDVGIDLTDHLIIAKENVLSLAEETIKDIDYSIDFRDTEYKFYLKEKLGKNKQKNIDKGRKR